VGDKKVIDLIHPLLKLTTNICYFKVKIKQVNLAGKKHL